MSSIDFEDFYRICNDSNYGNVEEEFILLTRKNQPSTEAKAPSLEDFDGSLDKYVPHEDKEDVVVVQ